LALDALTNALTKLDIDRVIENIVAMIRLISSMEFEVSEEDESESGELEMEMGRKVTRQNTTKSALNLAQLREAPALALLLMFIQTPAAKTAVEYLISVITKGTIKKNGVLSYRDSSRGSIVEIPQASVDYSVQCDLTAVNFIAKVIAKAAPVTGWRISFLAFKCVGRLVKCVEKVERWEIEQDNTVMTSSTSKITEKETEANDGAENRTKLMVGCTKALIALSAYPEMLQDMANFSTSGYYISLLQRHQPEHMKTVRRVVKRRQGWDHTRGIVRKTKEHLSSVEETIKALEQEVEFESVEKKEKLKVDLEQIKKELRIAQKRDGEVLEKYRQVEKDLKSSCEKVNGFLVILSSLSLDNETVQNQVVEGLGIDILTELIEKGGGSTLWATIHLVGCLCKNGENKATIGGSINVRTQQLFVDSGLLKSMTILLFRLVEEDKHGREGGGGLGEWRHCIEVLYWMLKDNSEGVAVAREEGLLRVLFDLSVIELPFAEFPDFEGDATSTDEAEDGEETGEKENNTTSNAIASANSIGNTNTNDSAKPFYFYQIPPGSIEDHTIDGDEFEYFYCTKCYVPFECRRGLRGSFKHDDGGIFSTHIIALIFEKDVISQESCLSDDEENRVRISRGNDEDGKPLTPLCIISEDESTAIFGASFLKKASQGTNQSGDNDDTSVSGIAPIIQNFFNEQVSSDEGEAEPTQQNPPSPIADEKKEEDVPASQASDDQPTSFRRIEVLFAILKHRLDQQMWGNAAGALAAISSLILPPPVWSDRNPSLCDAHSHLHVQNTGQVSVGISDEVVACGGDLIIARAISLVSKKVNLNLSTNINSVRKAMVSAVGPIGLCPIALLVKCLGRLCLSHEGVREAIVRHITQDKKQANSVPSSRAGSSRQKRSAEDEKEVDDPFLFKTQKKAYEDVFEVLIRTMINGVRSFIGQQSDGLALQHSSAEINMCDNDIKIEACCCISSLCFGHGGASQAFAEVGMSALKALVSHIQKNSPPELQAQACRCIYSTAVLKVVRQRLAIDLKALAPLLILLHSDYPDVVIYACCAIEQICVNCYPAQQFISNWKGLLPFVRICSGTWGYTTAPLSTTLSAQLTTPRTAPSYYSSAKAASCKAIERICERHTGNRDLAYNVKLIAPLVDILLRGDAEEKQSVVAAFSQLLQHNTVNRDTMVEFGGVEALTVICRLGDNFLKSTASLQMKIVCSNSNETTEQLVEVGGVPPLVNMLNSGDILLQRHASQCIAGLCMNDAFLQEMLKCNGITCIVGLLVCEDDETCTYCCITLGRCVARSPEAREIAKGMGAIQILVQISAGSRELKANGGVDENGEKEELAPNGLTDSLNRALRCTREAAICIGNFATDDEQYILDGSSNFKDGRIVSGMLPPGLLRKAPTTHQPSTDFSKVELVEDDTTLKGGTEVGNEEEDEDFVPDIVKRLSRRTEADRLSVMSAYIQRQEDLRKQFKRAKLEEEESSAESSEYDDEESGEWETGSEDEEEEDVDK